MAFLNASDYTQVGVNGKAEQLFESNEDGSRYRLISDDGLLQREPIIDKPNGYFTKKRRSAIFKTEKEIIEAVDLEE